MSLGLPPLYHWSRAAARPAITKRGLKPTCETAVWVRPYRPGVVVGHHRADLPEDTILTVCLGTSPLTAWALSGALSGERGEEWDLWEVEISADDEVHYRPHIGTLLDEVRVANRIPKSRVWRVGSRTIGAQRMSCA